MIYNAAEIGKTIRTYRQSAQMSQRALGKAINKDATMVTRIENAKHGISLEVAVRIASHFGITLDELLDGSAVRAARITQLKSQLAALEGGAE